MIFLDKGVLGLLAILFGILIIVFPEVLAILVGLYLIIFGFLTLLEKNM